MLTTLFSCEDLADLENILAKCDFDDVRPSLLKSFQTVACYRNVAEWNQAVRLCEALAIIGWGSHEPIEAVRTTFFNGNPMTGFLNRYGELRLVEAIWSQRKAGLTMENHRTSFYASPDWRGKDTVLWEYPVSEEPQPGQLRTQRNWIAKNPIQIRRSIANCYASTSPLVEAIERDLMPRLSREMQPERYGTELQQVLVQLSFSYFDHAQCKCNFVTFDEPKPLGKAELQRRLATLHSLQEVKQMGYFARNKFEYGNYRTATGTICVGVHFSKEFSDETFSVQRAVFRDDLEKVVATATNKLAKKRLTYNFPHLNEDLSQIISSWCASPGRAT